MEKFNSFLRKINILKITPISDAVLKVLTNFRPGVINPKINDEKITKFMRLRS